MQKTETVSSLEKTSLFIQEGRVNKTIYGLECRKEKELSKTKEPSQVTQKMFQTHSKPYMSSDINVTQLHAYCYFNTCLYLSLSRALPEAGFFKIAIIKNT